MEAFEIVCDALLLNKQQSVDLFANFIDTIARQFQRIIQNKQLIPDPPPDEKGIHPYWKVYQGVIALFREDQKDNFTPDELDLICELIRYPRIVPDTDVRALRKVLLMTGSALHCGLIACKLSNPSFETIQNALGA